MKTYSRICGKQTSDWFKDCIALNLSNKNKRMHINELKSIKPTASYFRRNQTELINRDNKRYE